MEKELDNVQLNLCNLLIIKESVEDLEFNLSHLLWVLGNTQISLHFVIVVDESDYISNI